MTLLFASLSVNPVFVHELQTELVTFPSVLLLPLPLDAAGDLTIPVPGGGGPLSLDVQCVSPKGAFRPKPKRRRSFNFRM